MSNNIPIRNRARVVSDYYDMNVMIRQQPIQRTHRRRSPTLSMLPLCFLFLPVLSVVSARSPESQAWTPEKSRRVAEAWIEEQNRNGLGNKNTFGDWSGVSDQTAMRMFERSEVADFPKDRIDEAAKQAGFVSSKQKDSTGLRSDGEKAAPQGAETGRDPGSRAFPPGAETGRDLGSRASPQGADTERDLGSSNESPYANSALMDISQSYDWFAQGYRMLGGFVDCDHPKDGNDDNGAGCSRWMMWAAYVNPNYEGGGYYEYYPYGYEDNDYSEFNEKLDCHNDDTEWVLMGVYRQEFYQYIEQLSKHLWAIDDYEYVTACSGLAYMTDTDCYRVGYDSDGNALYGGIQPSEGGYFYLKVFSDNMCLTVNSGYDFDDFGLTTDIQYGGGGSQDQDGDGEDYDEDTYTWWEAGQESSLANLNALMDQFKMCRLCMDYPTYQDGYFIGDTGTDDDSIINQCWKFHSHDSFFCTGDCIALAHRQGTITNVVYAGIRFGNPLSYNPYNPDAPVQKVGETRISRLKANIFVTFAGVLFIATFLAFAVARGSSPASTSHVSSRSKRSSRTRNLLECGNIDDVGDRRRKHRSSRYRSGSSRHSSSRRLRDESKYSSSRSRRKSREKEDDYRVASPERSTRSSGRSTRSARSGRRGTTPERGYDPPDVPPRSGSSRRRERDSEGDGETSRTPRSVRTSRSDRRERDRSNDDASSRRRPSSPARSRGSSRHRVEDDY